MHAGGVNCCMADGSVRFVSNYIDEVNWCRLISKADGQVITVSDFLTGGIANDEFFQWHHSAQFQISFHWLRQQRHVAPQPVGVWESL